MSTTFWKALKVTPALFGVSLLIASSAYAQENTTEQTEATTVETVVELDSQLVESPLVSQLTPLETRSTLNLAESTPVTEIPKAEAATSDTTSVLEQINHYSNGDNSDPLDQVTNVSQFRDVSPGDWAYEALRSLVERYGCIAGYPDGTFRGNRALTRYEFAAGLNACLTQIERLITSRTEEFVRREDLETLQRLTREFQTELTTLGTRVDTLEGRVAFLEDRQFSTTTKLRGEAIFSLASAFGEERAIDADDIPGTFDNDFEENAVLQDRVRLSFETSFTGKDLLTTRLEAGNFDTNFAEVTGTEMARLAYDEAEGNNNVELEKLHYRFPVGDNLQFHIIAAGADELDEIFDVKNPFFEDSGTGALSRFLRFNPAVYRPETEQAFGANIKFSNALSLDLAYLTGDGNSPLEKNGLFDGDYTAAAQLNLSLGKAIDLAFTYARSYYPGEDVNLSGSTSGDLARRPFADLDIVDGDLTVLGVATSANRFGVQASVMLGSKINISGWVGYIDAEAEAGPSEGADADIWTGAVNLGFLDLGKKGALLGIGGGIPPKVTEIEGDALGAEDEDTSYLVEAQYRYPITDNILITPGVIVIFNPNHNNDNDTVYVGLIRTTFSF